MAYIWQNNRWPEFMWDSDRLLDLHGQVRYHLGAFLEKIASLGFDLSQQAHADIMAEEVVKSSQIEGESFDLASVRSSVGHKLGLPGGVLPSDRRADGFIEVLLDATRNFDQPLTAERLCGWQAALFPTGYSGIVQISVGKWRDDREKPMQIVSGAYGRETVHFEAPPASRLNDEMKDFIEWFNENDQLDGLFKAGVAHLYFVTLHPFDDGNGRIARVLSDMALAIDEWQPQRFYSLSSQIMADRESYYEILKKTQKASLESDIDITDWLEWFLTAVDLSISRSERMIGKTMAKAKFWNHFARTPFNERQTKALNRLLDIGPGGFEGGMKNKKYVGITKSSRATAQRDLADLVEKGAIVPLPGGGRSASYDIDWDRWGLQTEQVGVSDKMIK